jgi:hypothetical protein
MKELDERGKMKIELINNCFSKELGARGCPGSCEISIIHKKKWDTRMGKCVNVTHQCGS